MSIRLCAVDWRESVLVAWFKCEGCYRTGILSIYKSQSEIENNSTIFQDGFLLDQDQPATKGKRDLKYEMGQGIFLLSTESYAKIKCDMEFALYPFDTQRCTFVLTPDKNLTYQEHNLHILFSTNMLISAFCLFQKFTTKAGLADNAKNEKFELVMNALESYRYFDAETNETFSRSGFTLIMERNPHRFLVNIYLSSGFLTTASFIGFLIPVDMVAGRMALLVTVYLMHVNVCNTEQNKGPVVSTFTI